MASEIMLQKSSFSFDLYFTDLDTYSLLLLLYRGERSEGMLKHHLALEISPSHSTIVWTNFVRQIRGTP